MFIKLTRLDHSAIWINASFVVTVEPRKGGGSVVVPIGDGLDYDVMESPEAVLALLADAPAPAAKLARPRAKKPRAATHKAALKTLQTQGVLSVEGDHVVWAS